MKNFLLVLLGMLSAGLLMYGCEWKPSNKKAADGYYFEEAQWTRTEFPVEIVLVQSREQMAKEVAKRSGQVAGKIEPSNVAAFAIIRPFDTRCTIYMLDPKVHYEPEYIGHELVHCIYGAWHKEPQK